MDKDIELQKIQALQGYFQTRLNALYSMSISFVVGYVIFVGTLYYQGVFNIFPKETYGLLGITANIIIFILVLTFSVYCFRRKTLDSINDLNDKCLTIELECDCQPS